MARRMSRMMARCAGLALLGALAGCGQRAGGGSWGGAIEVPGLGALNAGSDASVVSVSCAAPGSCAAGGTYRDGDRHDQGFLAVQTNGVWGTAIEVPGLGALNKGGDAEVASVSCAARGSCVAGGYYTDGDRHQPGWVVSEKNGRWGTAVEVPGLRALNKGRKGSGTAGVLSVSCGSADNCAAGGVYEDGSGHGQGFVAVETNGVWGTAIEVPGLGALNKGGEAGVSSVSCASAGNCAAGGDDEDRGGQGFVAVEKNGIWGTAVEVPGLRALNTGGAAGVDSVSCPSAGNCTVGGGYEDRGQNAQVFVASERNGAWGQAIEMPGLGALNAGSDASLNSVSCASPGNCAAGGDYGEPYPSAFVASERNGAWGRAISVPGLQALNRGRLGASVNSVSCAAPGNCAAGGGYSDSGDSGQGFVAVEQNGAWGRAIEVPGLGALNKGDAWVSSVSCAAPGSCAAGGGYTDRRGNFQGFAVSQTGQGG